MFLSVCSVYMNIFNTVNVRINNSLQVTAYYYDIYAKKKC